LALGRTSPRSRIVSHEQIEPAARVVPSAERQLAHCK
jgi:hypothetical protein